MTLRISLDRALPISVSVQLKGQIEYGIVSGAMKPGEQLPSVRDLAATEGVAHVTVSHVYTALQRDGLIVVRRGTGTFVAGAGEGARIGEGLAGLHVLVDGMVAQALREGFSPGRISQMVTARLASTIRYAPMVALVGIFHAATLRYAADMAPMLEDLGAKVVPFTVDTLREQPQARSRIQEADVIVTIPNRVREVRELIAAETPPVCGLPFVVHPETVTRLQRLSPAATIGLITTFGEFLPTMLHGVLEIVHPARQPLCASVDDDPRVATLLREAQAIVYASGSEAALARVPEGIPTIEYLHTPDRSSVAALRPLLERIVWVDRHPRDR